MRDGELDALIASGVAFPQGRARKVDGGYVVSGRWNFSSCVNVAEWNMLSAIVREGDRADAAFIIMEPEDTPPMSGSNSICVATVLLDSGILPMQEAPDGR